MQKNIFHDSREKALKEQDEKARLDREWKTRAERVRNDYALDAILKDDSFLSLCVTVDGDLVDHRVKDRLHHGPEKFFHYTPLENVPKILNQGVCARGSRKYNYITKVDWKDFVLMNAEKRIARIQVLTNWSFHIYPHARNLDTEWVTSPIIPPENILKVEFSGVFNLTGLTHDRIEDICKGLEGVDSEPISF